MTTNKFLKIIFGTLLVVIMAELMVLFFASKLRYEILNNKKISENKSRIAKTGQPLHIRESINTSSPEDKKRLIGTPVIHPTMLDQLAKMIKVGDETNFYIVEELKFKVIEVEPKGACVRNQINGASYGEEVCFPFAIKIDSSILPQEYNWIYFTKNDINKIKVFIKNKNNSTPLSLKQIQPGDIILIIKKWDPSIPPSTNQPKGIFDKQIVEETIYIINRNI